MILLKCEDEGLAHPTPDERRKWRLIGRGEGIHWPDLDEDAA